MKLHILLIALAALACCPPAFGCRPADRKKQDQPDDGPSVSVSGRILLRPPVDRLPANARLTLKLQDISLADAPAKLLASKTMDSVSGAYSAIGGIPFTIDATIPTGTPFIANAVAVSATLSGDGVSYLTDTSYYVDLKSDTFEYRNMDVTIIKYPA